MQSHRWPADLAVLPTRLFVSALPAGELEFACFVRFPAPAGEPPADSSLAWQLSDGSAREAAVAGRRPLTPAEITGGRAHLAATLPPAWPGGRLLIDMRLGDRQLGGAWPVERYQQRHVLQLPLDGQVFVAVGHRIGETHRGAWELPCQQFGWDMLPLDLDGLRLLRGPLTDALRAADFAGFGAAVRAPAAGRVAVVVDGITDEAIAGVFPADIACFLADPRRAAGNYAILDHGAGVWSVLAHLQHGSVCVREGQELAAGNHIGALGNSGYSSGPHLHVHFMDGPDLLRAAPLPLHFTAEGATFAPQAGQIIGA